MRRPAARMLMLGLAALAGTATAAGDYSSVSDAEIRSFKQGLDRGCRNRGQQKGDPAEQVDAVCGCVTTVLERNLSHEDWQRAVILERRAGSAAAQQVMRPYMPRVKACIAEKRDENATMM